jgi:hypothetical protein
VGLILLSIMLALAYVTLVGKTVYSIVERKNAESALISLGSRVGALEHEYLALTDTITPQYAAERGFTMNAQQYFVIRDGLSQSLTLRNEI